MSTPLPSPQDPRRLLLAGAAGIALGLLGPSSNPPGETMMIDDPQLRFAGSVAALACVAAFALTVSPVQAAEPAASAQARSAARHGESLVGNRVPEPLPPCAAAAGVAR